jgi:hypothetical protein
VDFPSYWLPRPGVAADRETAASFDRLLDEALDSGPEQAIDYRLSAPKWQFLCHAAERGDLVLHGSGNPDITELQPRQPMDVDEFSNRNAVYAATDGIWPMFFAILDRERHRSTFLCNSCVRVGLPGGQFGPPYYFFSISRPVLEQQPWRDGTVYLLPAATFELQPPMELGNTPLHIAQAAGPVPVKPLAKLSVRPSDFPYLRQVHGHDDEVLTARIAADPNGFPWFEES